MASEGVQLRAAGVPVTLADGTERRLRFTLDSLLEIEEECGSLLDYLDGIGGGFRRGKTLTALVAGLAAGLRHDRTVTKDLVKALVMQVMGQRGQWGVLQGYVTALDEAWEQAVPRAEARDAGDPKGSSSAANGSPGQISSVASSASSESVPATSGA